MTDEDYKNKLAEIEVRFKGEKDELAKKFANEIKRFSIGDIVTDGSTTIYIDKIQWSRGSYNNMPFPVYLGPELKKDLTPKKNGDRGCVWQSDKSVKLK